MRLDPNADGKQWLYKKMTVVKQDHPKLLKYAAYDNENFIAVSNTQQCIKEKIKSYLLNNC